MQSSTPPGPAANQQGQRDGRFHCSTFSNKLPAGTTDDLAAGASGMGLLKPNHQETGDGYVTCAAATFPPIIGWSAVAGQWVGHRRPGRFVSRRLTRRA